MLSIRLFAHFLCIILYLAPTCLCAILDPSPHSLQFPQVDLETSSPELKTGDELVEAAFYTKAIGIYRDILQHLGKEEHASSLELGMLARFRLGYVYFLLENYPESISVLKENLAPANIPLSPKQEQVKRHSLYLLAIVLKHAGHSEEAKGAFKAYTQQPVPPALSFYEEAILEIGLLDFLCHRYDDASKSFETLVAKGKNSRLSTLAKMYMARMAKMQGDEEKAVHILMPLRASLSSEANDNMLLFELNYLLGETAFELGQYQEAITYFKEALPAVSPEKMRWYADTLYQLGWSYLKTADNAVGDLAQQRTDFMEAEKAFTLLVPDERTYLALAQCLLSQAKITKPSRPANQTGTAWRSSDLYAKAEEILSKPDIFASKEAQAHALLLRAEAAPSYILRDQFYQQLTAPSNSVSTFYAQGWFMQALNDFEHGQELLAGQHSSAAKNAFVRATKAFQKASELLASTEPKKAREALKYQALATSYSMEENADRQALSILDELIESQSMMKDQMENMDELYYLRGYFAGKLVQGGDREQYVETARHSLEKAASISGSRFGDKALDYLGALYYQQRRYSEAEKAYMQLTQDFPESPLAAAAWLWSACCADKLHPADTKIVRQRRQYAFEHFPGSPFAAEAYFTLYTYPEYIQGDRTAIKHLQTFVDTYSDTPFLIDANFLIGLDYKRDRKTAEGKWIRKKSFTDAIDAFQKAELLFDEFLEKGLIPAEQLDYYTAMRYRATLERALANLAIADEAQGAKRQIYLDYAEEVLTNLQAELQHKKDPYTQRLFQESPYPLIEEETSFWLAQTYVKAGQDEVAGKILADIADRYKRLGITKGYYLARTLDEQGKIAMKNRDFPQALQLFQNAKEVAKGDVLNTDHKLDLWIRESLCHREMQQYDDAILILSKVINDDAISALRVKAMYLRAEVYELQKRPELARRQLESMVKKGGIWAKKAQEKLEKDFHGN